MNAEVPIELRCPTCGAAQQLSDECRRCKCDLSLVAALHRQRHAARRETLHALRDGRYHDATLSARRLWALAPDADAARYLVVCRLLQGDFAAAAGAYEAFRERELPRQAADTA